MRLWKPKTEALALAQAKLRDCERRRDAAEKKAANVEFILYYHQEEAAELLATTRRQADELERLDRNLRTMIDGDARATSRIIQQLGEIERLRSQLATACAGR